MVSSIPKRYALVSWLFVLSAIAYLDRTNISIAGIAIGREFHLPNTRLGWIFSSFLIGYAVFQIPAGLVVRRFGSRAVLAFAAVWWAIFTVLTTVVPPGAAAAIPLLIAVRFGLGVGEAAMYPATTHFVEHWFPVAERGKANGIIFAGVGAGSGLTPPVITFLVLHYGWRASFWFSAVLGLLAGAVWYAFARNTPLDGHVDAQGKVPAETLAQHRNAAVQPVRVSWVRAIFTRNILALTVSYFTFGYVAWVFFAWFYIYLAQARGLNLKASALYSTLPFLFMTAGCLGGGAWSDFLSVRYSRRLGRCLLPAGCMALTAVLLVVGSRVDSAPAAGWLLAVGAGVLYVGQSCFWAVAADSAGEYASVAAAVMNMGAQLGGALTASLTPLLASSFGWHTPFAVSAVLALSGALCWLLITLP